MDADAGIGQSRPDRFGEPRPPAAPRSGASYRHPVRVLHLDPRDPPRRWRRIGPPECPPLEAVLVPGLPGTVALTLWQDKRGIMLDMALLQSNPELWDLVYQGLLASIAAGAELSEDARQALRQPCPLR